MDFRGPFWIFLSKLHSGPSARIYTPGFWSCPFPFQKGMWKGFLLSTLMLNLTMEPLSHLLSDPLTFQGIKLNTETIHTALFAVDGILFMAKPFEQPGQILTILYDLDFYSNLQMWNTATFTALDSQRLRSLCSLGLSVAKCLITYLTVKIWADPYSLYGLNLSPILGKIQV